jgi:integrase
MSRRADRAWNKANVERKQEGLPPLLRITLQECRHSYVSWMHDAGVSLEQIGDYVGHSSAYMTDRYRHLLDGHEGRTVERVDAYLRRAMGEG